MKGMMHAVAGVLGFILATTFLTASLAAAVIGTPAIYATVMGALIGGLIVQIPTLAGAGATGMSLLGKRETPLGLTKQVRGPRAFMTTLLILLPATAFLWYRADTIDAVTYGVQALQVAGLLFCIVQIGLNIRDGLALRGRIRRSGVKGPVVEMRVGGPLVVMDAQRLEVDGKAVDAQPVLALCRCGHSKNKPFCDGSHAEVGFDSTPNPDPNKDTILTYEGDEVTIHYNKILCSHAAECGRRQKAAFDSSRKPWIVPDNAPADALREIVKVCPSGALRISTPGGEPKMDQPELKGIEVEKNGPYRVNGIPIAGDRAKGANPEKYVLCRCGASTNKPFCDGSHFDIGWKDSA